MAITLVKTSNALGEFRAREARSAPIRTRDAQGAVAWARALKPYGQASRIRALRELGVTNDSVGRLIGIATITPHDHWRMSHAVHQASIPFYWLPEVLRDHGELVNVGRVTLLDSLRGVRLALWDEEQRRLISFKQLRAVH